MRDDTQSAEEALAAAMPIIVSLFNNHLEMDPSRSFGKRVWNQLLENRDVYDQQSTICYESFNNIKWSSPILQKSLGFFRCTECGSTLVKQENTKATNFEDISLRCTKCQKWLIKEEVFDMAINDSFPGDWHKIVIRGGTFPTTMCPNCGYNTWILDEGKCALCQSSESICWSCRESCHPDELDEEEGICQRCIDIRYQMGKD